MIVGLLILGSPGVALPPSWDDTELGVRSVQKAATGYAGTGGGCPTLPDLVEAGFLDERLPVHDEWGVPLSIVCKDGYAEVSSDGPDHRFGTADDIH